MRSTSSEKIECPLCSGAGELSRAEILDRLGVRDFARVAQLSAEEAFRLLQNKHDREHQTAWSRFETELAKRTADIREQHKDEIRLAHSEKETLTRRVEDSLREISELREKNHQLETEMAKVARVGKREEMDFADEARTWAGIWISDKLPRNGDFILAYRAPNSEPVDPKILIDNKDKSAISETDIDKLVRDARERSIRVESSTTQSPKSLCARSYHRLLRELIMASSWREEFEAACREQPPERLFSELLPFYGQLAAGNCSSQFDVLVLDEAQDLLNSEAIELLGTLLKGGITGGRWYVFGDFTRQCIYGGPSREARLQALNSACQNFARTNLRTNCRNSRRIGEETALLSGFSSPPYKLGQVDGLPVDYRYWKNSGEQLHKLGEVVGGLLSEGMNPNDLVLLSKRKFCDSVAAGLSLSTPRHGTVTAVEIRSGSSFPARGTALGFATVHSFKGMETPAAIFCDVDHVEDDEPQALLYIGMSRARSVLIMMVHESVRHAIANALAHKLTEGWKS